MIYKSFKYYDISVKTDGLEDDMIFDYDNLIDENQENELLNKTDDEIEYNNWSSFNFV